MAEITLEVEKRDGVGKNANRRLRRAGYIPAVVYGGGRETVSIQVKRKTLQDLLKQSGRENAVFLLKLAGTGKARHTMIRELDVDPIRREVVHVDFQRIVMTEKVRVAVPIELVGLAEGVKNEGGVLDFVTREVDLECLPANIPPRIELDVSALHVGQHLEVKHLVLPPSVELLDPPDRVIVSVAHSRVAEEVAVEVEAEAEEELLEAEKEEPEVIRRGKAVEEEAAEEG